MCRRLFASALLAAVTVTGQFNSLVTNGDGSVLYFSSGVSLHGSPLPKPSPTIFLYRQDTGSFSVPFTVGGDSDGVQGLVSQLTNPDVSSDGNVVGFSNHYQCSFTTACYFSDANLPYLAGGDKIPSRFAEGLVGSTHEVRGLVRLSRSGRYAVSFSRSTVSGNYASLLDLQSRDVQLPSLQIPIGFFQDGYQTVSDEGRVLIGKQIIDSSGKAFQLGLSHDPVARTDVE